MIDDSGVITESMLAPAAGTTPWARAVDSFARADTYWLATSRPDGRPHVTRVLAVWANSALHFCTSSNSRKGKNLASNPHCVIAITDDDLDLILEGKASLVRDDVQLHVVAGAYETKYGWRVTVRDRAFHDTEGAPTAGPPPYDVYRIVPVVAFGLGTGANEFAPTRWRF